MVVGLHQRKAIPSSHHLPAHKNNRVTPINQKRLTSIKQKTAGNPKKEGDDVEQEKNTSKNRIEVNRQVVKSDRQNSGLMLIK